MTRSRWMTLTTVIMLFVVVFMNASFVNAQDRPRGRLLGAYQERGAARPAWVAAALERSLQYFERQGKTRDNFQLRSAERDDIATHVRLDQRYHGLPVFGGQLIAHIAANGAAISANGRFYEGLNLNTTPRLTSVKAIAIAEQTLGYRGQFAESPSAQLLVLPRGSSAILTYKVGLRIEDGTDATANHQYFINAQDGSVAFYYNDLDTDAATGTGNSLYRGSVPVKTVLDTAAGIYYLSDSTRGNLQTTDMYNFRARQNNSRPGAVFTDNDNVWGDSTTTNRQSAAVDAHYGAALTWDFYLNNYGRAGIDGNGYRIISRVHYGRNYNNAFWNGTYMTYGDGDGTTFTPLVAIDIAGHEITHGLTEKTANLTYSDESGAANESFSDIFGTMVEFSSGSGNYLIGEDAYTPGIPGDALRDMANPTAYGQPDNYANRQTGTTDNGGVHTNSGIQNNAFYLLAEGGTNHTSGLGVVGIGRNKAADIFYRALTVYLVPSSNFHDVRVATLTSAADLYGQGSAEYNLTAQAWTAVGVE